MTLEPEPDHAADFVCELKSDGTEYEFYSYTTRSKQSVVRAVSFSTKKNPQFFHSQVDHRSIFQCFQGPGENPLSIFKTRTNPVLQLLSYYFF